MIEDLEQQQPVAPPVFEIQYRGTQGPLFKLGFQTAVLTLLTLGIYRFWAKTRVRKYFWSATAPGGDPFEYTGNGLEKLLGFLIAVAFLAIYLGIFQLLLSFAGLSLMSESDSQTGQASQIAATNVTLIAIVPFIFYAQYRARRYILSRTRWRGIRFGVEPAAWGYVWRAMAHWLLTILSLGLLLPRQTFWLEKYKVDRTWYGTAQLKQKGRWQMLYPAMKHFFIAIGLLIGGGLAIALTEQLIFGVFVFFGAVWIYYGITYYMVTSFKILTENKKLGPNVTFSTAPRPSKVFWTYILGALLASTCAGLVLSAFFVISLNMIGSMDSFERLFDFANGESADFVQMLGIGVLGLGYIAMMLSYGVFALIFVSQPILEHYVSNTTVNNPEALDDINQRERDEMVEAEGFADALDVGAAI